MGRRLSSVHIHVKTHMGKGKICERGAKQFYTLETVDIPWLMTTNKRLARTCDCRCHEVVLA